MDFIALPEALQLQILSSAEDARDKAASEQVCKLWRDMMLNEPACWRTLRIPPRRPPHAVPKLQHRHFAEMEASLLHWLRKRAPMLHRLSFQDPTTSQMEAVLGHVEHLDLLLSKAEWRGLRALYGHTNLRSLRIAFTAPHKRFLWFGTWVHSITVTDPDHRGASLLATRLVTQITVSGHKMHVDSARRRLPGLEEFHVLSTYEDEGTGRPLHCFWSRGSFPRFGRLYTANLQINS